MYDSISRRKQHAMCVWIIYEKLKLDIRSVIKISNFLDKPPYNFCSPPKPPIGWIIFRLAEKQWKQIKWQENKNTNVKRLQLLDYYAN